MTKGKYGLSFVAVAIVAFVLAFFGLLEALILFLAFALILEKDQWLSRQVFQAFYLRLTYVVLVTVVGWAFTAINAFFGLFNAYRVIAFFNNVHNVIGFLLQIGLFVMALIAVLRLAKSKDAGLPLISKLVDATFGLVKPKVKPQPVAAPPYQAPVQTPPPPPSYSPQQNQQPYQPPAQPTAPPSVPKATAAEPPPPTPPVSDVKADGTWTCGCGKDNKGNFCMSCGSRKSS